MATDITHSHDASALPLSQSLSYAPAESHLEIRISCLLLPAWRKPVGTSMFFAKWRSLRQVTPENRSGNLHFHADFFCPTWKEHTESFPRANLSSSTKRICNKNSMAGNQLSAHVSCTHNDYLWYIGILLPINMEILQNADYWQELVPVDCCMQAYKEPFMKKTLHLILEHFPLFQTTMKWILITKWQAKLWHNHSWKCHALTPNNNYSKLHLWSLS